MGFHHVPFLSFLSLSVTINLFVAQVLIWNYATSLVLATALTTARHTPFDKAHINRLGNLDL